MTQVSLTKEWFLAAAEREKGYSIGAGAWRYHLYRAEWQSRIDGEWMPGSEWASEVCEALEAQDRWRGLGYNTRVSEEWSDMVPRTDK